MQRLIKPPRCRLLLPVRRPFTTDNKHKDDGLCPPLPLPPKPPPPSHHDIESFLAYADAVGLSPEKSVHVGTLFEYVCTMLRVPSPSPFLYKK